jgi:hypothetical protein
VAAIGSALIDFTEAVYDLAVESDEWLPKLLEAGAPVIDHGLGVFALTCMRPQQRAPLVIDRLHALSAPDDLIDRLMRLQRVMPDDLLWPLSRPGMPKTLSETAGDDVEAFNLIMRHFDFAKDGLGLSAFDPNGYGVYLIAPLPKVMTLPEKSRERWQMIATHFGAGYRLRRALQNSPPQPATSLPHGAEVVIDPSSFRVTDAEGQAKSAVALKALREAAMQVDRARGKMRETDPEQALEHWKALVRGRWSTARPHHARDASRGLCGLRANQQAHRVQPRAIQGARIDHIEVRDAQDWRPDPRTAGQETPRLCRDQQGLKPSDSCWFLASFDR